jgi:hypothetical protein
MEASLSLSSSGVQGVRGGNRASMLALLGRRTRQAGIMERCLACEAVVSRAARVEGESSGRALSQHKVDVAIERWQKWGEQHVVPLFTTASQARKRSTRHR